MTYKDRTSEFNSLAETARAQSTAPRSMTKKAAIKSQFMLTASQIGKDIFECSVKLNKLTKLAKKRSLFDDPSAEIEELTFMIKQDIQGLNRQIATLKSMGKGGTGKQAEAHNDTVIGYLNTKLASTTKDFKDILQTRTETLRTQQERKQRFTGGAPNSGGASLLGLPGSGGPDAGASHNSNIGGGAVQPLLRRRHSPSVDEGRVESMLYKQDLPESPARGGGEVAISMPISGSMMMVQKNDYVSSRVNAVESIEKTIGELQGIFSQLANLVVEQGEMIERIDSNVDMSLQHVEGGHRALWTHLESVMSNRSLIIKLFLVLIVFIVLFVVFFV
eukprot:TRINITY_DN2573_c0_g1_i1.p1 TRINITY_DN2573_c0_g1~~TRINITY_DN2573_c0_g1_i1.p1  ORF type:complete len:333 (-),score=68.19 TRINITY_DN2573_c0_g1_i1:19-1017(-)